jgi:cystathionine beta-lyase/cystathionine gamma-synthase
MTHDQSLEKTGFATRAIHVGQAPDPQTGAVSFPIYQTSTFAQFEVGSNQPYDYARSGNPTRTALEQVLASLDGGCDALAFASGLAAETAVLHLLAPGDHVVASDDVYGGTHRLLTKIFSHHGITTTFVDVTDHDAVSAAFTAQTRLLWIESPTNPMLRVADIAALSAIAKRHNALTVVDNTFASPYLVQPLRLGADIVSYSTTKYHGGHSDVIGGALVTNNPDLAKRLRYIENAVGSVPAPFDLFLIMRGIKTLALRMQAHCRNAQAIAEFLAAHPAIEHVYYPGLPDHPQHALAAQQMRMFGGMVSFTVKGGVAVAHRLVESTTLFTYAVSLGGVESLIELPRILTHAAGSAHDIPAHLVRISAGIEDTEDLIADLRQALAKAV